MTTTDRTALKKHQLLPRDEREGLLIVNTGNGKGKTTAALGILLRAAGYDMKVGMFQFIKSSAALSNGEHQAAKKLGIDIVPLGDGFTWLSENIAEDRELAEKGWAIVKDAIENGDYDVLIFDELTYPLTFGWLDTEHVLEVIRNRHRGIHVIVTGRNAPPALIEAADLATEMYLVKHPFREKGIGAQAGIEI